MQTKYNIPNNMEPLSIVRVLTMEQYDRLILDYVADVLANSKDGDEIDTACGLCNLRVRWNPITNPASYREYTWNTLKTISNIMEQLKYGPTCAFTHLRIVRFNKDATKEIIATISL
jgi:hypothetical protein